MGTGTYHCIDIGESYCEAEKHGEYCPNYIEGECRFEWRKVQLEEERIRMKEYESSIVFSNDISNPPTIEEADSKSLLDSFKPLEIALKEKREKREGKSGFFERRLD